METRAILERIWWAGVKRVQGYHCVKSKLETSGDFKPTKIAAVGKAASSMMRAALDVYGKNIPALSITKYDHSEPELRQYYKIKILESAHPVPDEKSLEAGKALVDFVETCGPDDQLLLLVSGGASALVESLAAGISLDDLRQLNSDMLAEGLDIHAMNARRREVSLIKGGRLLHDFKGSKVLVLAISDVEGDDLNVIGSGIGLVPTFPPSEKYNSAIIASNFLARDACETFAEDLDLEVIVNTENLYCDVFEAAKKCAETVRLGALGLYIFGGEPTTILPENPGEGGRNQALAVAMARELSGVENVYVLAAGTDGSDGPTGSAGGFVTGEDWQRVAGGEQALNDADSGAWLRRSGGLFVTGPTGTNVMDLMVVTKG